MKEIAIDNTIYRIGKNAQDNTKLIKSSESNWFWFHLDKFPSCHVVVCKGELTKDEIHQAGTLVKENSKYKFNNIAVCYCKINNLIHGDEPGSVSYKSNRAVNIINI